MGLNLNPILRQELANLDKDTESRKTAMKALKSYVKDLDSKAIPSFLAQVSETKETNSLSGEYTISLYEILARVHGPNIVPQIDTIMSTIVKTLASSAGSFPLQQACSKVVPAIARYGIDPTEQEENKKRSIIHSLCKPLSDSLLCSQESLASGSALCLKALVDCDNWRFASDEMVNKVCQNVVVALDANSNQTHLHMGLVMALAKRNPLIVEAYARLLIHTGVRILGFGVKEGNSQKRLSAVQMINFLMKCLDPRSIYSEVELIVKEMERCQTDQMAYVRGAAYEAMVTSKRIAGELEGKMEKKGCRSVTGSNFGGRKCSPDDNESLSPESQTLGGSFSGGYDSPVESSPRSSCNFDGRSVNRKLWRSNGVVDISLKDGLFSGDTTVSDSPLVPYDHCDNEFEGFVMGSLRNRRMQNTTPTSPQRQCCSRNMNAEDFNIYSTPRKLISSLQYPDDMEPAVAPVLAYAAPAAHVYAAPAPQVYAAPAPHTVYAAPAPHTVYAAPEPHVYAPAVAVAPAKSQFHAQDEHGQYTYGYTDGSSAKTETRYADGETKGSYSYVDDHGSVQAVHYSAGAEGFKAAGTNIPVHHV